MKIINLIAATALMSISIHSYAGDTLTGDQIKEIVSNKTCDIEKVDTNNKKKKYLKAFAAADGSRLLYIPWKDKTSERKWWVEGNKYCGSHPKRGDYCRDIVDAGNGVYHALNEGEHLRTFSNCRDGNQL